VIDASAPLFALEPDFGVELSAERREAALRELTVRTVRRPKGSWCEPSAPGHTDAAIGLLIVSGVVMRQIETEPTASAELLGPGDIVRPWDARPQEPAVSSAEWTVLSPLELAVLDANFVARLAAFPEVMVDIGRRLACRSDWLAEAKAISQLTGVEDRLTALFAHLAFRWGKVTKEGLVVPIPLPHSTLAALIGARRPTVTSALGQLAVRGVLVRRTDGTWVLAEPEHDQRFARRHAPQELALT
jgi:CRP-like cAMP-binding protein